MDCQSVQTAPALTLRAGGQTGRQPFSVLEAAGLAAKTCPVAETRRLSRSPPPLVAKHAETPLPLGRSLVSFLRSVSATARPYPPPGTAPSPLRNITSERIRARSARQERIRSARVRSGCPDSWSVVFRSFSAGFSLSPSPARCHRGPDAVPSEDYSRWPPCSAGFLGEGRETETEQQSTKKRP